MQPEVCVSRGTSTGILALAIVLGSNPRPQTASMTFVARNVPPGNRVVRVQFSTSGGTGFADFRSLQIGVYKS